MRIVLISFFVILSIRTSKAQVNLVPNPSFEDTVYCPYGTGQIDACANWMNFGNSPDYFNICTGPTHLGLPENYGLAYQYPHCGNAMAGVITYQRPDLANGPNYREFLGIHLTSSMIVGQKYYAKMYVNYSNTYNVAIASNKIGMRFSTIPFDSCCPPAINNSAAIYTDSILTDTINWIKISGSFIADSAYQYVTIGNFFDDLHSDTLNFAVNPAYAYYFIDDLCISIDSTFTEPCPVVTSIQHQKESKISIGPNPSDGTFTIVGLLPHYNIRIYNLMGESIPFHIEYAENKSLIQLLDKKNQMLLFQIFTNDFSYISRIIINL